MTDQVIKNQKSKIKNLCLAFLLLLYLTVALAHAVLAPLTIGPDELAHYEYVNFIAETGRLPRTPEERSQAGYKSDQPPLYHLITALPASLVDPAGPPYLKRYSDHLRRELIGRPRHAWGLYNTEDEAWPYRGEILRWHTGRWMSIFFGVATVLVTYLIARRLFQADWPALAAAATVAFIPRFVLSGSMLNYETTLAFFASLFLGVLLRMGEKGTEGTRGTEGTLTRQRDITHHTPRIIYPLLLGFFAGLAITTKLSALILGLEIVLGLGLIAKYRGWGRKWWGVNLLSAGLALLVTLSLWFGFILYHFNTVATDGWWVGLLRPLIAADASDATTNRILNLLTEGEAGVVQESGDGTLWRWPLIFFRSFWVAGIETVFPLGQMGLVVALGFTLLALAGLRVAWHQTATAGGRRLSLSLLLLHVALGLVLPLARFMATRSLADTAQGRHLLFLTAPAIAILLVWGMQEIVDWWGRTLEEAKGTGGTAEEQGGVTHQALRTTHHAPRFIPFLLPAFLLAWSLAQLQTMTWAYLPPLPVWTMPEAKAQVKEPLAQPLNEAVSLLGYERRLDPENRVVALDLWWEATAISPVDYLTEVTLVDEQEVIRSRWLGYPANGRYPTRAWDVGDIVRETVWLPVGGLEAGSYRLNLKLVPVGGDLPPPAEPAVLLGSLVLTESTLRIFDRNLAFASEVARAAGGYSIWQAGRPSIHPPTFQYRETILVTLHPHLANQERAVWLLGPPLVAGELDHPFPPVWESEDQVLFIVGPEWPSGGYRLHVSLTPPGQDEQQASTDIILRVENRWERSFSEPAIPHRLEANFGGQVKLLGYDLGANRVEPGDGIPLTLYWQGLDWLGENYTIFTKLLAADGTVHGGRDRLPQEGYSTLYWAPGEVVIDSFEVPIEPGAPDGIYYLNIGLYKTVNLQAHSLPLVQDGQPLDITSLNLGPVKIGQAPPGVTRAQANPQHLLEQPLGEAPHLTLMGYDLLDENNQPIENLKSKIQNLNLRLYWRSEAILPLDYTTFVHLRNEAGETVAQQDQPPLQGAYPTSLWDPGEIIVDEIVIPIPSGVAGEYDLLVGLYDFQSGARLTIPGHSENSLTLTTLELNP